MLWNDGRIEMYIQRCVKGIPGSRHGSDGITWEEAKHIIADSKGIISNWWLQVGTISPGQIADVLTDQNLDRHLHDYDTFGSETPFISLACGAVERNTLIQNNFLYSAIDTALQFATEDWARPGALFFLWVPTSHKPAIPLSAFAEPVRDVNIYRRWSPYQLEGEITAKIGIPANQIERVEWWDSGHSQTTAKHSWINPDYVEPDPLSNIRDLF